MQELILKIEKWAEDRNIIKGSKPIDQAMKLFSEFGELADSVGKGRDCRDDIGDVFVVLTVICKQLGASISQPIFSSNRDLLPNDITKNQVAKLGQQLTDLGLSVRYKSMPAHMFSNAIGFLEIIADHNKTTLQECVQIAYDDIRGRKGLMHNGVFLKESDPVYAKVIAEIEGNLNVE